VASSKALDVLHQAMCPASYRCIRMAIKIASKIPAFFNFWSSLILIVSTTVEKDHVMVVID
jgi:hypothetical protein